VASLGRQENHEFEASLGYIVRPCLKNKLKKIKIKMKMGEYHLTSLVSHFTEAW
jgi:hypothetical protein